MGVYNLTLKKLYVTTSKYQLINCELPVLLYQLGSDQLESYFSTIRTIENGNNLDFLDLIDRINHADQIEQIYQNNIGWKQHNRSCFIF